MIIRSRRKNRSLFSRFIHILIAKKAREPSGVLSEAKFKIELAKETSRSNRRLVDPEYAVVQLEFNKAKPSSEQLAFYLSELRSRLRIADSIGKFQNKFSILCPETDRDGGKVVANEASRIGLLFELQVEAEILVYPWDDSLVAKSEQLNRQDSEFTFLDDDDYDGTAPQENVVDQKHASGEVANHNDAEQDKSALARFSSARYLTASIPFAGEFATPWWKRATDVLVSTTLLILLSPVFLLAAIAIKMTSRGPVFFRQLREGKDGKSFLIWKFRTMVVGAESQKAVLRTLSEQDGPAFKLKNDPRVTPVGRYLRKSCVDELPQLVNVLMGQMSMVGPRPLPVDESIACMPWQRQRLQVLPGLTCIWQVEGGRDALFSDWMRMDMRYIQQRSFLFDIKLISKTAVVALLHRGSV